MLLCDSHNYTSDECFSYGRALHFEGDYAAAASWLSVGADQGHAPSEALLGLCYFHGDGVANEDHVKASVLWARAAVQGDLEAQLGLAVLLLDGDGGIEQDQARAVRMLQCLVAKGNSTVLPGAQHFLAYCYHGALGVTADTDLAAHLWEQAAANGHPAAGRIVSASSLPGSHPIECSSTKTTSCCKKTRVEQLKWDARVCPDACMGPSGLMGPAL